MIIKRILSAVIAASVITSAFAFSGCTVSANTARAIVTESYGENLVAGGDFEGAAVGESTSTKWQPYYNRDVAFGDIVSNEGEGNEKNVYEGTRAVRFCNVGAGNSGRGLYYADSATLNADVEAGATYCLSGYFRTNNPDGEQVGVLLQTNQWASLANGDIFATATDEWQEFKFYTTMPASNAAFGTIRLCAINASPECLASSKGYAGNKAALDASETGYCIYADNIQVRKVYNTGAANAGITATSFTSDGILFANYDYWGKDAEKDSTLKWLYSADAETPETEWQLYKSETVKADEDVSEAMLIPGAALSGKYVRISVTPKDMYGNVGQTIYSEAHQILKNSNVIPNAQFADDLYIWTGDVAFSTENCDSTESGSMAVSGTASFAHESVTFDIEELSVKTEFYAKSNGSNSVTVDGNTFEVTDEWQKFTYERYITAGEDFEIEIASDGCLIDNFSVIPQIPEVYGISISGKYVTGSTLEIDYECSWDGTDNSTVVWYLAENETGENAEAIGTGRTVKLLKEYASKYIYAVVTPVDSEEVTGLPLRSAVNMCIRLYADKLDITSNGFKTNSILVPEYEYYGDVAEGKSKLEWQMAPSLKAPDSMWEKITLYSHSSSLIPAATVTEDTVGETGYLMLTQNQTNMYVRFKLVPVNADGEEGQAVYSEPTELIEFERNIINNGDFGMGTLGWSKVQASSISFNESGATDDGTGSVYIVANTATGNGAPNSGGRLIRQWLGQKPKADTAYVIGFDAKFVSDTPIEGLMSIIAITDKAGGGGIGYWANTPQKVTNEWTRVQSTDVESVIGDIHTEFTMAVNKADFPTAGDIMMDNFVMYEAGPWLSDIKIEGNPRVGSTLVATYKFNKFDDLGNEYDTKLRWEKSDYPWGPWSTVKECTGTAADTFPIDVTSELEGKYLRVYIETGDELNNKALPQFSAQEIFVEPGDVYDYTVSSDTLTAGTPVTIDASFESAQELERDITVVAAIYKTLDNKEKMTSIAYETDTVTSYGSTDISLSVTPEEDGGELRVYFMEGADFKKLKPLHTLDASGSSSGSGKTQILVDNDNASVKIEGKTTVPESVYSVNVIRNAYDSAEITPSNVKAAVEYFGQGTSSQDKSFAFDFSLAGVADDSDYALYIVQKNGEKQKKKTFTYSGSTVADAIAQAVLAADVEALGDYLNGTLINGTVNMVDVLAIDLSKYENVNDKTAVLSQLAGTDYSGNTIKIKTDLEQLSEEQLEYEVWTSAMDELIADLTAANISTVKDVLKEHNSLLGLDIDNKYGFDLSLSSTNRKKFNTDVLNALKSATTGTYEEVEANLKSAFKNSVALAAVNYGAWESMGNILDTNKTALGISLANYNNLSSGAKTTLHQNIFNAHYNSTSEFSGGFEGMVSAAAATTPVVVVPVVGGTAGGSSPSAAVPMPTKPDAPVAGNSIFTDLPTAHWAYDAISLCKTKAIINGYDDGTFKPEKSITRAEFLSILLKTLGISVHDEKSDYSDVAENDWYYEVVTTAAAMGISKGYDDGTFKPNYNITREEMCVFITRAIDAADAKLAGEKSVSFTDKDTFSGYAASSIDRLSKAGIVNGMDDGTFVPKGLVTRAMAAKIAYELTTGL